MTGDAATGDAVGGGVLAVWCGRDGDRVLAEAEEVGELDALALAAAEGAAVLAEGDVAEGRRRAGA